MEATEQPPKKHNPAVFVSSEKILKKLHEQDMTQSDLARHLKRRPSQISRGLRSQQWLRTNLEVIASLLRTDEARLCMSMAESAGNNSPAPGTALDHTCGGVINGEYALPAGCAIRALGSPQPTWYLVGPASVAPRDNDAVEVELKDGSRHLRLYSQAAEDGDTLVLWSRDKNERPMVKHRRDIKDLRVIITSVVMPRGNA